VPLQPPVLGAQGIWHRHGLRGNKNLKARSELLQYVLRTRHQRKILKEVLSIEKRAQLPLPIERRNLPQALAGQIVHRHRIVECLVVAAQVLGERIRHHLVHVHTDALQPRLLIRDPAHSNFVLLLPTQSCP